MAALFKRAVVSVLLMLVVSHLIEGRFASWRRQQQPESPAEVAETEEEEEQTGVLWSKLEQLRQERLRLEQLRKREEDLQEELEDLVGNYELEELAQRIGLDTLGRILRPLREVPTQIPIEDCVTQNWPVEFEFGLAGTFVYRVCGTGDAASVSLRFQLPGETTPAADTTTSSLNTTTAAETTTGPTVPLCPVLPAVPIVPAIPQPSPTPTVQEATDVPIVIVQEITDVPIAIVQEAADVQTATNTTDTIISSFNETTV